FPDHWSFLLGEVALYAFVVLVATGIFLTFFYEPSDATVRYHGAYEPLQNVLMSKSYESVLNLSFDFPAGLLMRQTHHWAADVFLVAIVLHVFRVFFTGAFRKPRDINWFVGLTLLMLAILEGYLGYSLIDDLLSGMGLAIGYSVAMSLPLVGANFAFLVWGGQFPGGSSFFARLEILHVLVIPVLIAVLISVHLATIVKQHHSQFPGPGRTEANVVGTPMWPAYALRSAGLLCAVAAVLFLIGGLVQINPIWLWGPYHTYLSMNGAQPDWYIGWLIGALRVMPPFEPRIGGFTIVPNPFWGGALFPLVVFGVMYSWPWFERRVTKDYRQHDLLDRPRDNPWRTAVGAAFFTWVFEVFFAGVSDRIFYRLGIDYEAQVWFWRFALWILPILVYLLVKRICEELRATEVHPLRGFTGAVVERTPDGTIRVRDPAERG
ncbi:MAG TPA: cytochrome b N-terminal domain-containing protein, partial [Thermoleophilaceae bacterium]|nr:cytochrome b N-terminal domain-containing protein [Thermoleophilaceae bacterium]